MSAVSLTPWLTGAGSRRLEGTNIGHENAEGMAYVGVRVEPPVRLVAGDCAGEVAQTHSYLGIDGDAWAVNQLIVQHGWEWIVEVMQEFAPLLVLG